jgi:hypothetical protein
MFLSCLVCLLNRGRSVYTALDFDQVNIAFVWLYVSWLIARGYGLATPVIARGYELATPC